MLQRDFMLRDVSVVVLDEVHERSQAMDVIVGLVTRLSLLRRKTFDAELKKAREALGPEKSRNPESYKGRISTYPLKVIFMSATLRA